MEEKQFLLKTNQELHEKVHCVAQHLFNQPSQFSYSEVANTVRDGKTDFVQKNTFNYGVLAYDR